MPRARTDVSNINRGSTRAKSGRVGVYGERGQLAGILTVNEQRIEREGVRPVATKPVELHLVRPVRMIEGLRDAQQEHRPSSVGLPFFLARRDAPQLVDEVDHERQMRLGDRLPFGRRCDRHPHAIRVQSVHALPSIYGAGRTFCPEPRLVDEERAVVQPVASDHQHVM